MRARREGAMARRRAARRTSTPAPQLRPRCTAPAGQPAPLRPSPRLRGRSGPARRSTAVSLRAAAGTERSSPAHYAARVDSGGGAAGNGDGGCRRFEVERRVPAGWREIWRRRTGCSCSSPAADSALRSRSADAARRYSSAETIRSSAVKRVLGDACGRANEPITKFARGP